MEVMREIYGDIISIHSSLDFGVCFFVFYVCNWDKKKDKKAYGMDESFMACLRRVHVMLWNYLDEILGIWPVSLNLIFREFFLPVVLNFYVVFFNFVFFVLIVQFV